VMKMDRVVQRKGSGLDAVFYTYVQSYYTVTLVHALGHPTVIEEDTNRYVIFHKK
jgi:hypothetical protein